MKTEVVCFGEVLWDVFPDGQQIVGGAPLNVALRLHALGVRSTLISAIGTDDLGDQIVSYLRQENFSDPLIHRVPELETGKVMVTLDEKGSASYHIAQPVAWDAISYTSEAQAVVRQGAVFVYGSLAARSAVNRECLRRFLGDTTYKVMDLNLRPPHDAMEIVLPLAQRAQLVKMNDEELEQLMTHFGFRGRKLEENIRYVSDQLEVSALCVTRGRNGAALLWEGQFYECKGYAVKVKDTVGAGDSFLACLIKSLILDNMDPLASLQLSCALGSLVASKEGANCMVEPIELQNLMQEH